MCQLGAHYRMARLIHSKDMEAICKREHDYPLRGMDQIDDPYLGGERNGDSLVVILKTRFQSSQRSL